MLLREAMASAADMMAVQAELANIKGIVEQLAVQMQTNKIDLGNITAAQVAEMKSFEEQTVAEVNRMKEDIKSTILNATQEFEAQRQSQAIHNMQIDQQQVDMESILEEAKVET